MVKFPPSLAAVHARHKTDLPISYAGACVLARNNKLAGVEENPNGYGLIVVDENTALQSLKKLNQSTHNRGTQ